MLELVAKILGQPVCDHCLGRQFAQLGTGYSNRERGSALRQAFAFALDSGLLGWKNIASSNFHDFRFRHNKELAEKARHAKPEGCSVCEGFFPGQGMQKYLGKLSKAVKGLEFATFLVGTKVSKDLLGREEKLWEKVGIEYCEPLRAEINREFGKLVEKAFGKRAELLRPDLAVLLNLEDGKVELKVNPLYVFGYYRKLVRGIPQCRWGTPGKYKTSVEQEIGRPLMKAAKGKDHKFHGAGREDIDAKCLAWRAFVLEVLEPRRRKLDLKALGKQINRGRKVAVGRLSLSDMEMVRKIKSATPDKTYRLLVLLGKPVKKKDLAKLRKLKGPVSQKTPERVLHRRADLLRKREVKAISWRLLGQKRLELKVKGTAGLYVKELVSGDGGRTRPSVAEVLGVPAKVKELDVVEIGK